MSEIVDAINFLALIISIDAFALVLAIIASGKM